MFIKYEKRFDVLNEKPESIPVELTQAQAIEDLNQYVYLLETSCAGFLEQRDKINFQERYNQVLAELKTLQTVRTEYFLMTLLGKLAEGVKDLHSFLFGEIVENNQKVMYVRRFIPKIVSYYSKNFFKKKDNHFVSTKNRHLVLNGEIINQKTKIVEKSQLYFLPCIHKSKEVYKAAKFFTWSFPEENDFIIEEKKLDFEKQNFDLNKSCNDLIKKYKDSKTTYYFVMPDCGWSWDLQNECYGALHKYIDNIRKKKNLIIDNRWNRGGIPLQQLKFLTELFGYETSIIDEYLNREIKNDEDILEAKCLLSNPIVQKEIENTEKGGDWKYKSRLLDFYKNELAKLQNGKIRWSENEDVEGSWYHLGEKTSYDGKIFLLVDSRTASMGEQLYLIITEDFDYKNVVLLGTNTIGCMAYSNPISYFLKNSGIRVQLTSRTEGFSTDSFQKEYLEGRGLIPDFWATNDSELEETLDYLCKKEEK